MDKVLAFVTTRTNPAFRNKLVTCHVW